MSSWRCPASSLMEQISFVWSNIDLVPLSLEFLTIRVENQQQQELQDDGNKQRVVVVAEGHHRKLTTTTLSGSCYNLGDCPLSLLGNIMYFSVILARMQVPTGPGGSASAASTISFATTVFCCLLSLTIWTVAVVGTHNVRSTNHDAMSKAAAAAAVGAAAGGGGPRPQFWFPTKEDPTLPLPHPSQQQQPQRQQSHTHNKHLPTLVEHTMSWPPILQSSYRMDLSTEDNYQAMGTKLGDKPAFCQGKFADIRRDYLDYNFHKIYSCERQQFQDSLIESMLLGSTTSSAEADGEGVACSSATTSPNQKRNWIVFTAGVMGAGKSFTMKQLHEKGRFPLDSFVTVDPDSVRRHLPEFDLYVHQVPEKAGYRTRKESGMISEILTEAALQRGQNVLVDGTLRNSTWYQAYFQDLRKRYPSLQIGILHVTSPREAVLERAMSRAKVTGRVVPRDLLERTMVEVPKSIHILSKQVDYFCELHNPSDSPNVEIATEGVTWDSFQRTWKQQSCNKNNINKPTGRTTNFVVVDVDTNTRNHNENSSPRKDFFAPFFRRRLERQRPQLITAVVG